MTITQEQEPQRALAWAQRLINSNYTEQALRELVVYLMRVLDETDRRLQAALNDQRASGSTTSQAAGSPGMASGAGGRSAGTPDRHYPPREER